MDLNFFSCLLPKLGKELTIFLENMLFQKMEVSKSVTNKIYYKNLIKKSKKEYLDRFRIFLAAKNDFENGKFF